MSLEEQEFKKGFNQGYLIKQYRPDLKMDRYAAIDSVFYKGVIAGGKQYEMERKQDQIKERFGIGKERENKKDRDR